MERQRLQRLRLRKSPGDQARESYKAGALPTATPYLRGRLRGYRNAPPVNLLGVRRRTILLGLGALLLAALVAIGASQQPEDETGKTASMSLADQQRALAGAPPQLAGLHAQANELLDGGTPALRARLRALRGRPVIVNVWGSWCGPCRAEFPLLQRVAADFGRRIAFLGIDTSDNAERARRFLSRFPVSYPSYDDPRAKLANVVGAGKFFPTTVFYGADGKRRFMHQGGYFKLEQLEDDVREYALASS